jgi:hypothetical protein
MSCDATLRIKIVTSKVVNQFDEPPSGIPRKAAAQREMPTLSKPIIT